MPIRQLSRLCVHGLVSLLLAATAVAQQPTADQARQVHERRSGFEAAAEEDQHDISEVVKGEVGQVGGTPYIATGVAVLVVEVQAQVGNENRGQGQAPAGPAREKHTRAECEGIDHAKISGH